MQSFQILDDTKYMYLFHNLKKLLAQKNLHVFRNRVATWNIFITSDRKLSK